MVKKNAPAVADLLRLKSVFPISAVLSLDRLRGPSDDAPWLTLGAPAGGTPADLSVAADPSGLGVGRHHARIAVVTAAGTETVDVWLAVQGEAIHLPLVSR